MEQMYRGWKLSFVTMQIFDILVNDMTSCFGIVYINRYLVMRYVLLKVMCFLNDDIKLWTEKKKKKEGFMLVFGGRSPITSISIWLVCMLFCYPRPPPSSGRGLPTPLQPFAAM